MGFLGKLLGQKSGQVKLDEQALLEAGACPNCWGRQSYDNKFTEFVKDQTKANTNHDKANQKAFVQQFVETHVSGIKLKLTDGGRSCPTCKKNY